MIRLNRREVLGMLATVALRRAGRDHNPATEDPDVPGLGQVAAQKGIRFGTAVATDEVFGSPAYAQLVRRECSLIVPTWEMKWGVVAKSRERFNFAAADRLADFARTNGLAMRGHAMVWYRNMPPWLPEILTPDSCHGVLDDLMGAVMRRYRDQVVSWDVVNEAVEPADGRPDGLRESFWLTNAGPGYIAEAFRVAAATAPGVELVLNDYGCEHDDGWNRKRRLAVLRLLESLKKEAAPVTAFGLQSHLRVGDPFTSKALAAFLHEVAGFGLKVVVTELEVRGDRVASPEKGAAQASLVREYLDTVLANSACDTIVSWGLSDRYSWRRAINPSDQPLPFDEGFKKKPLYGAIAAAIAARTA